MVSSSAVTRLAAVQLLQPRWAQLMCGIICMVMIANLQYGWNLFVDPIDARFHWGRAAIQVTFTLFVLTETWLVPVEGWFVDRYGPRIVVTVGALLVAIAWVINSKADSLPVFYAAAVLAGSGAGAVYGTCVANALKWFGDRRGLAAGLTAAGFGAGAALTIAPIRHVILEAGYPAAFFWFGLGQGLVILLLAQFLKAPQLTGAGPPAPRQRQSRRDFAWQEVVRTRLFWVLYVMFVLVASGGLMATAQLAAIAADFGVADQPVSLAIVSGTTLTIALAVDNVLNGLARPFFGWVSDRIGREVTMSMVFSLGALSILGLGFCGHAPWRFIMLSGLVYFTWGEIYSLFPATCTDAYGAKFAATNAGLLYTAKGSAALFVPLANLLASRSGGWQAVFVAAAVMDIAAAVLALAVLKPLREAWVRAAEVGAA